VTWLLSVGALIWEVGRLRLLASVPRQLRGWTAGSQAISACWSPDLRANCGFERMELVLLRALE
jgi:hypothetical protein